MKVLVEVTDILADAEILSELRDYALSGDIALGGLACRIIGPVTETRQADGYGGIRTAYHAEKL